MLAVLQLSWKFAWLGGGRVGGQTTKAKAKAEEERRQLGGAKFKVGNATREIYAKVAKVFADVLNEQREQSCCCCLLLELNVVVVAALC